MMTLVLALRGVAAVGVLVALVGGIPHVVRVGLALVVGMWSAALVAPLALPDVVELGAAGAAPWRDAMVGTGSDGVLWLIAARELVVGATIGVVAAVPLLAAAIAGRLVDRASGLNRVGAGLGGPYSALFGVLAAAVFVGVDGHVSFVEAIVESFRAVPLLMASEPRVLSTLSRLVPAAVQLAVPWLVTAAVVEIAVGVAMRLASRAAGDGAVAAAPPAALVMMTATLVGTLAVAIAALVR